MEKTINKAELVETPTHKIFRSEGYNFDFDKRTGFFARWGNTLGEDGDLKKGLPEIADIEISTICSGVGKACAFCYKSNTPKGEYMNFSTFKKVFAKLPPTVTQIAFGIGDIEANPDMWKIFDYCRAKGVIPNVTVNGAGITDEIAKKLATKCGAVAVSLYNKELTYNTVKKLTDLGLEQTNIHFFLAEETFELGMEVLSDIITDKRLKKMKAIVFLSLKKKGRAKKGFTALSGEKFKVLSEYALENNIPIGFDSCSSWKFLKSIEGNPDYKRIEQSVEPCESSIYSAYINVKGEYFPCSFMEGEGDWKEGIDVLKIEDFLKDIWFSKKTMKFKNEVINCRECKKCCPFYEI